MKTIGSVLKRLLLALGGSASENYLNDITLVDRIAELAENGQIPTSVIQELTFPLPISKGGHAATTAAQAAKNLGVLPLGEVATQIPSGADLNNYTTPGVYAVDTNAIAQTLVNKPVPVDTDRAGTLRVFCSNGADISSISSKYLIQEYIGLTGHKYYRYGISESGAAFSWSAWETIYTSANLDLGNRVVSPANSTTVSVHSLETTEIASIYLPAGIWLVVGIADWQANGTGYRQISLSETTSSVNPSRNSANTTMGIAGKEAYQQHIFWASGGKTIKMYGLQNSGATINVYPYMFAVMLK